MKEPLEGILQLYTKGSRDMKLNYRKSRTIKPRYQVCGALAFPGLTSHTKIYFLLSQWATRV